MKKLTLFLGIGLLLMTGCGRKARAPIIGGLTSEQVARGIYRELGAFIGQAQKNHPECSADKPQAGEGICPALHEAIDVQNRLADGINLYCSGVPLAGEKDYNAGGPCSPIPAVEPKLAELVAQGVQLVMVWRNR